MVLVAPVTSQIGSLCFPATVRVNHSPQNGLSTPSVILVFQARAIDRVRFVQKMGTLAPEDLASVLAELNKLTGQR